MTIATLMATSAIFLVQGLDGPAFGALAITIGGVVCIAASNSGDTSQDLKTGYIVGSTPRLQQIALMIGVVVSTIVIGFTLNLMNTGLQEFRRRRAAVGHQRAVIPASPFNLTRTNCPRRFALWPRTRRSTSSSALRVHHSQCHRVDGACRTASISTRRRPAR